MPNKYKTIVDKFGGKSGLVMQGLEPVTATPERLSQVEAQIGYPLPPDYREFLMDYGNCIFHGEFDLLLSDIGCTGAFYGAIPNYQNIADNYTERCRTWMSDRFCGYDSKEEIFRGIHLVTENIRTADDGDALLWPCELLPIGEDSGNSMICLALYGLRPGAVFYWRNSPFFDDNVFLVANSFDEFMNGLY